MVLKKIVIIILNYYKVYFRQPYNYIEGILIKSTLNNKELTTYINNINNNDFIVDCIYDISEKVSHELHIPAYIVFNKTKSLVIGNFNKNSNFIFTIEHNKITIDISFKKFYY